VRFVPSSAGDKNATLVASNGVINSAALHGTGVGSLSLAPVTQNYGNVAVGQSLDATFTVANTTTSPASLATTISGANAAEFARIGGSCSTSLAVNNSCTIIVRFAPASGGSKVATLSAGP